MKIVGNKICPVCIELNNKNRKKCVKCNCELKQAIKGGSSSPQIDSNRLRIFRFEE